jgi:hypothetical protein
MWLADPINIWYVTWCNFKYGIFVILAMFDISVILANYDVFVILAIYDIFVILAIYDIFIILTIYAPVGIQIVFMLQKVAQWLVCVWNSGW